MSNPRYDTTTTDNGDVLFGLGGQDWHTHTATVRDNQTGKTYESTNYDAQTARDQAWEKARNDRE